MDKRKAMKLAREFASEAIDDRLRQGHLHIGLDGYGIETEADLERMEWAMDRLLTLIG